MNRLTQVEPVGSPVTMTYDAWGRRTLKKTTSEDIQYLYDFERLLAETDGSGTTDREYTQTTEQYGDLLSAYGGGASKYYAQDALGSTELLLNDSQTASDAWRYRAFGLASQYQGTDTEPMQFVGKLGYYTDAETGLILARGRYYDPVLRRWFNEDPFGYRGGDPNLYRYCFNDPLNQVDPSGNLAGAECDKSYANRKAQTKKDYEVYLATHKNNPGMHEQIQKNYQIALDSLDKWHNDGCPPVIGTGLNLGDVRGGAGPLIDSPLMPTIIGEPDLGGLKEPALEGGLAPPNTMPTAPMTPNNLPPMMGTPSTNPSLPPAVQGLTPVVEGKVEYNPLHTQGVGGGLGYSEMKVPTNIDRQCKQILGDAKTNWGIDFGIPFFQDLAEFLITVEKTLTDFSDLFKSFNLTRIEQTLVAFVQNPYDFADAAITGFTEGIAKFFEPASFVQNLQSGAMKWLVDQLAGLDITVESLLQTKWDQADQVLLFFLKAVGLNLEQFEDAIAELPWLEGDEALNQLKKLVNISPESAKDIASKIKEFVRANSEFLDLIDFKTLIENTVTKALAEGLKDFPKAIALTLSPVGGFKTLYSTLNWFVANKEGIAKLFGKISEGVDALADVNGGNTKAVSNKIEGIVQSGLKLVVPLFIGLFAKILHITPVISSIRKALLDIKNYVQKALRKFFEKILGKEQIPEKPLKVEVTENVPKKVYNGELWIQPDFSLAALAKGKSKQYAVLIRFNPTFDLMAVLKKCEMSLNKDLTNKTRAKNLHQSLMIWTGLLQSDYSRYKLTVEQHLSNKPNFLNPLKQVLSACGLTKLCPRLLGVTPPCPVGGPAYNPMPTRAQFNALTMTKFKDGVGIEVSGYLTSPLSAGGSFPPTPPDWWKNLPLPIKQWRQGHLIGRQFGGAGGTDYRNLAPIRFQVNNSAMAYCENRIRSAIRCGHCVTYTIKAIYELDSDLFPKWIQIVAKSPQGLNIDALIENKLYPGVPITCSTTGTNAFP